MLIRFGREIPKKKSDTLTQKIKKVLPECAKNKNRIWKAMRQFVPRLRAVKNNNGYWSKPYIQLQVYRRTVIDYYDVIILLAFVLFAFPYHIIQYSFYSKFRRSQPYSNLFMR